jgi:flagellar biogenesis protein FliO
MKTDHRPLRALSSLALGLALWSASAPSAALEPAGGSPEPAAAQPDGERDASVAESPVDIAERTGSNAPRSWLARGGDPVTPSPAQSTGSGSSTGFTLAAAVLVLGLGAAAVVMRMKRQKLSPLAPSESRLTVLSSSRVGPKAFAVTAHVNGRVLLLGVTDHAVTNLGWLDAPEASVTAAAAPEGALGEPDAEEDLPDDYPGSALRASRPPPAFASSSHLKRFEEVLRGAAQARPELPMRPSYHPPAEDAATLLAAQTTDVVAATPAPAPAALPRAAATATPVSLRRKRRARESLPPRDPRDVQPRVAAASRAPRAPDPSVEGQVAGLRALRNGG